ncbi:hypothetical protein [Cohaesibacter celericrescens]|uniref:Integrase n=1 Tax=Cohaesibacter celericrescens TaxID=2067669 RepID=A0A2N5XW33_9HYPH|nr:hypothetical protein [Cohaesibacter celericrescens]PLW78638.1 hypothetical protein C0081_03380 [Cohaesibacter celericrescens]
MNDPTKGVTRFKDNPDGYHTWTDVEIDRFETHHDKGSAAVMAYLGHRTQQEARKYVQKANRTRLGDSGMAKFENLSNPANS